MKRILILFFISLMLPIGSFSQIISPDTLLTAQDLKKLNLILVQHSKWESEVPILYKQIDTYQKICKSYEISDSIYKEKESLYKEELTNKNKSIKKLRKSNKILKHVSIGTSIISLICLILL